ncbi:MAG: hypothetical protein NTU97_02140 [Candidatus Magasanikbacteria bacterium]|nr:hypothetical protein [Candidatus Magasanikbacteria bacterium]
MAFPLYYLLFILAAFGTIYVIFVLMDLYHLVSFAEMHFTSFVMTFVFLAGVVYICFWGWTLLAPLNWNEMVVIFNGISFNSPTY